MPETRLRRSMTRLLGFGHLTFFVAWLVPLHGTPLPGRLSVAHQVAASVPVWSIGFGATAGLLLVSAYRKSHRLCWWGHAAGVVVTMAFAGAVGSSALIARPTGSLLPALAFLLISAWHLILQRYYKAGG